MKIPLAGKPVFKEGLSLLLPLKFSLADKIGLQTEPPWFCYLNIRFNAGTNHVNLIRRINPYRNP